MSRQQTHKHDGKRESGLPGGGAGRKDQVGGSGVYPMSGPHPPGNAPLVWPGGWGQGARGGAGYEDAGESELNLPRVQPELCRDIMSKDPVFCQASDTAVVAAKLMEKHNIGALPVVGNLREMKLAGIVTDRDLAMKVVGAGLDPHSVRAQFVMSHPVATCSPDDPYQTALDLMERRQVKRIPAVDRTGRVVGMISEADVALRIGDQAKTAEVVSAVCRPS